MKVLSLIPYKIFPARPGGQKGIALFNEYLSKYVELQAFTVKSNLPEHAPYKVINELASGASRYSDPRNIRLLKNFILANGITHLLLEHPYFGWLGIALKKATGIKLVVHSHNIESVRWKTLGKWWWRILWQYEKLVHRAADYNFFIHDDDRKFAIGKYQLNPSKCTTITYGIDLQEAPGTDERAEARDHILKQYSLAADTRLLLFNGSLNYAPNLQGLKNIPYEINPILFGRKKNYRIIVCGSGLPETIDMHNFPDQNIIYAGFVEDINVYFKAADIFLNPIVEGGGIKTKLVEAIGNGCVAISTANGSIGLTTRETGGMLRVVEDGDWKGFAQEVMYAMEAETHQVPDAFFEKFYWGNIARKAADFMRS